ncbi:NADH dehydrogenase [ubiquinone] 1 beta subcomplex subunit 7-like [Danaus plexippus]|uniref:NADH dehydrogenase [ubiquinone] 1 beta subcomplex subunit 7-like n=1 Tax=Danaus plexippus TaxID=13037 RepID=UPI0013C4A0CE|nr:NADH dehydrogenase [ubiquinone] 1 beta subcomplex subunit 7-like [Danaus plexippus]
MGNLMGTLKTLHLDLRSNDKPTFDAKKGFGYTRAQRKMIAKDDDLISARIPPKFRDYCAHLLLDYQVCRYKNVPLMYKCHKERHSYLNCEHDDYVIRMQEFERERRLRERELRLKSDKK